MLEGATARFAALVAAGPEVLAASLDEAVLLIAAHARDDLDVDEYRARLDEIAARCPARDANGVVAHVFRAEGFRGNVEEYYDPRNSYLDQVIDRRVGIPITLAVVGLEVARRVGVPAQGVGMPGHFLLRTDAGIVDPFEGGRALTLEDCAARFHAAAGAAVPFTPDLLEPADSHAIVARILANLRQVHLARRDSANLEWVLRLRGLLPGASLEERAERAGVLAALGRFGDAADLLDELVPEASEATAARLGGKARQLRARLN